MIQADLSKEKTDSKWKSLLYREVKGFLHFTRKKLSEYCKRRGILLDSDVRAEVLDYFSDEDRNPRLFELIIIDGLRSRGLIVETERIGRLSVQSANPQIFAALELYHKLRKSAKSNRPISLFDIKTVYSDSWFSSQAAKEDIKPKKGRQSDIVERPGLIIDKSWPLSDAVGIPSAYYLPNTSVATVQSGFIVMLFIPNGNASARELIEALCALGAVPRRGTCLLNTILRLNIGCVLDFATLEEIGEPTEIMLAAPKGAVVAALPLRHTEAAKAIAQRLGYTAYTAGKTINNKSIVVASRRKELFNIDIDFLKGETGFAYADLSDGSFSVEQPSKQLTKRAIINAFAACGFPKDADTDFGKVGRIAAAPFGGRMRLTPTQIMAAHTETDKKVVITSCQNYNGKIDNPFLAAVYSVIVAYEKLIVSGMRLDAVKISDDTPAITDVGERSREFLYRLGIMYAKSNLYAGVFANEYEISDKRAVYAGGILAYDRLISNVFSPGQKLFRLPLKRDNGFMPDFKYILKLANAVSLNIISGNIAAAAVVEDSPIAEVLKSCLGDSCGFALAKSDSGILKPNYGDLIVAISDISQMSTIESEYIGITDGTSIIKGADIEFGLSEIYKTAGIMLPDYRSKRTLQADADILGRPIRIYGGAKKYSPSVFLPNFDRSAELIERGFIEAGGKVSKKIVSPFDAAYLRETRLGIEGSDIVVLAAAPDKFADKRAQITKFVSNPVILDSINELLFRRDGIILAFGEAFYSLIELGFLPFGRYVENAASSYKIIRSGSELPTGKISRAKIVSNSSPWLSGVPVGTTYSAVSADGECVIEISDDKLSALAAKSQICSQYVDFEDMATMLYPFNPTGNTVAIESLCSPDGRIFGSVGHNYKVSQMVNVKDKFDLNLFKHGIEYFR